MRRFPLVAARRFNVNVAIRQDGVAEHLDREVKRVCCCRVGRRTKSPAPRQQRAAALAVRPSRPPLNSMIEQKIEKPPTCPACGSSSVRRAGVITRKTLPAAQLFRCACCSARFFSPTTPRGRRGPGASKQVSRLLDGRGDGISSRSERPGTFTISIRRALIPSLEGMHRMASGWGAASDTLAQFCSELLEVQIITFREQVAAQKRRTPLVSPKPAPAEMRPLPRRSKLSPADVEKIRTLLAEGALNQSSAAARYRVAQSTVARAINGNGNH